MAGYADKKSGPQGHRGIRQRRSRDRKSAGKVSTSSRGYTFPAAIQWQRLRRDD